MKRRRLRLRLKFALVPIVLPALTILATADCYGPTEVTVVVSTDLTCAEGPLTTGFFKGAPGQFDGTAQAETTACSNEPTGTGSTVGTLVLVPSASTDGEAAIKVILARPGKTPAACLTDPKDCILARRAFNYSDHQSRRLPIRLAKECLGVACGENETCVAGPARCVSAKTICEGASCLLPEERPPPDGSETGPGNGSETGRPDGPPVNPVEGGEDGPIDTDAGDPVVTNCTSSTGQLAIAQTFPTDRNVADSPTAIYYVKGETPDTVYSIPKLGGRETVYYKASGAVRAIAVDGTTGVVVGFDEVGTRWIKPAASARAVVPAGTTINDVASAPDTTLPRVYGATTNELWLQASAGATFSNPGGNVGAVRIAVDATNVYFVNAAGVLNRFQRSLATAAGVTSAPTNPVFFRTAADAIVHVGGRVGTKGALGTVSNTTFTAVYTNLDEIPQSVGIDANPGAYYWYHAGNTIYRITKFGGATRSVLATDDAGGPNGIQHLMYDDDPGGCIYYWRKQGAGGRLIVRKKSNL